MKNQLDVACYFISLIMRSTCFGHYYIHIQEPATLLMNYHITSDIKLVFHSSTIAMMHGPRNIMYMKELCRFPFLSFFFFFLFPNSLPVYQGILIHEVSRSRTWHTTVGRTPLYEWSARRSDLYLTTQHSWQTSMTPVGFETNISAGERPQTHALDRAVTVTSVGILSGPNKRQTYGQIGNIFDLN